MSRKLDKRKNQWCYNCRHFDVRENKTRTRYVCGVFGNSLVGAMWCKYYKSVHNDDEAQKN